MGRSPDLHPRRLVTIITEAALETAVVAEIRASGASGWTATEARGGGHHGIHGGGFPFDANVRIEVICDEAVAERLLAALDERYMEHAAMLIHVAEVAVLRHERS